MSGRRVTERDVSRLKTDALAPAGPVPVERGIDHYRHALGTLSFMLLTAALAGCAPSEAPNLPGKLAATAELGPVRATVEIAPAPARLSDELAWTLTIAHEPGVEVRPPALGKSIGEFLVREIHPLPPAAEGGREVTGLSAALEPTRPGKIEVPPLAVTFVDRREGSPAGEQTLETKPLTVEITSALAGNEPALTDLRPMHGPVALPPPYLLWAVAAAAGVAVAAAVVAFVVWRRRRPKPPVPPPTPAELAERELAALLASGLMDRDVKRFYVELTGIVRRYIERTTSVRAAEQTTEEFLRQIHREATFPPEETRRLGDFLESADLVKFAAHRPREEDLRQSVERARAVVTRPVGWVSDPTYLSEEGSGRRPNPQEDRSGRRPNLREEGSGRRSNLPEVGS